MSSNKQQLAKRPLGPFALERDFKAEMTYVVISVATFIALTVSGRHAWAVQWLMATFFMFGVWRIARSRFR